MTDTRRSALATAIDAHIAASNALDAQSGPGEILDILEIEEDAAALAVARAPVASDAELIEKLRYLFAYEASLWGAPVASDQFGLLAIAVGEYLRR